MRVKISGDLVCNFIHAAGQTESQAPKEGGSPRPNPYSFKASHVKSRVSTHKTDPKSGVRKIMQRRRGNVWH